MVYLHVSVHTLATALLGLLHRFDNSNSDRLSHITDGEATERWIFSERLNTHGLRGDELDNGGIARLDKLGRVLDRFTRSTVDLLQKLREFACNVRGVAIEHGCVASANLTGVVEDNHLGVERGSLLGGVVLRVGGNVTTANFLDRDVPANESATIGEQAGKRLT
jgi:hypothetical protein